MGVILTTHDTWDDPPSITPQLRIWNFLELSLTRSCFWPPLLEQQSESHRVPSPEKTMMKPVDGSEIPNNHQRCINPCKITTNLNCFFPDFWSINRIRPSFFWGAKNCRCFYQTAQGSTLVFLGTMTKAETPGATWVEGWTMFESLRMTNEWHMIHRWKLTWHWKIHIFSIGTNRKYIFKWWIFHCHVSFPGGNSWWHPLFHL